MSPVIHKTGAVYEISEHSTNYQNTASSCVNLRFGQYIASAWIESASSRLPSWARLMTPTPGISNKSRQSSAPGNRRAWACLPTTILIVCLCNGAWTQTMPTANRTARMRAMSSQTSLRKSLIGVARGAKSFANGKDLLCRALLAVVRELRISSALLRQICFTNKYRC